MNMKESYVNINNIPTYIQTYGKWVDDNFNNEKEIVLLLPGNPGFCDFYPTFLSKIHENLGDVPVWTLSYAGHGFPKDTCLPKYKENEKLFNIKGQVEHKAEFIRKYVPKDVKIHLMGHSIGAYIILELLKIPDIKERIQHCYLLFPTLERLAQSPNAFALNKILDPLFPLVLFFLNIVVLIPYSFQLFVCKIVYFFLSFPKFMLEPGLRIIHPNILPYIVHLCQDEMMKLSCVDINLLKENKKIIKLYYGKKDGFVPINFYYELLEQIPDIDAELDNENIDHGFFIKSDIKMANIVTNWIRQFSVKSTIDN